MSDHKTSAIRRPRGAARRPAPDKGRTSRRSRRSARRNDFPRNDLPRNDLPRNDFTRNDFTRNDFTQPIAIERQLVTRRGNRWVLALLALGVIGALAAALFVLPVQAWLHQQDDLNAKQAELAVLAQANTGLQQENARLQTPEGAKEAARDELGVVDDGEKRVSVLPAGQAPLTLPGGWPYDTVSQILDARAAIVAAAAATTTVGPAVP